jgi:hypothetical protein
MAQIFFSHSACRTQRRPRASEQVNWSRPRTILLLIAGIVAAIAVLFFPRVLAFVELAARELRYFWWLILLVALSIWLIFFFGKKRD